MWKWINQHTTSVGQRKNLSPRQDSNLRPPKHRAGALSIWATENSWRARPYTARISNFDVYCVVKEWKMVNFKLGETKLCENWVNQHVTGVGQGKKINKERKKVIEINTPKCSLKNCNLRFLQLTTQFCKRKRAVLFLTASMELHISYLRIIFNVFTIIL